VTIILDDKTKEFLLHVYDATWEDIRHSRAQEWKMLEIVSIIFIAMVGLSVQEYFRGLSLVTGGAIILLSIFGLGITYRHRSLFSEKMAFIRNIENALGLNQLDILPVEWKKRKQVKLFRVFSTSFFLWMIYVAFIVVASFYLFYIFTGGSLI
jgi:disulfide bond formation protein DsbB